MAVVLLSNDLMASSKLSVAARTAGVPLVTVSTDEALLQRCETETVWLAILDLSLPGLVPADLVPRLRALATPPRRVIAFGPHVHVQRLQAARDAECDEVLSRGEFHARMDQLLAACRNA